MSEKCQLSLQQDETGESKVWNKDILSPCRTCVESQLQKAHVRSPIYYRLRLDGVVLDEAGETYSVGLSYGGGLQRLLVVRGETPDTQEEEVPVYFLCDFAAPGRTVETVKPKGYL